MELFEPIFGSEGFWVILGTIVGSYITAHLSSKQTKQAKRNEAYAELIGIKKWMKQVYLSRFEAFLFSDFHEERCRLQNYQNNWDLQEAKRWMEKSENLALEASRTEENLAKIIGSIFCYFKLDKNKKDTLHKLLNHPVPLPKRLTGFENIHELEKAKDKDAKDLKNLIENLFDSFFDPVISIITKKL